MKILIVSDSHYDNETLENVTKRYKDKVDMMIHCGDSSLPINDPLLKDYLVVKGNHDDANFPFEIVKDHIFITHGQKYGVYYGYEALIEACKKHHCSFCFHGHTHVPTHQIIDGIHFINPGSLMINRGSYAYGTFALANIENQEIDVHFYHHTQYYQCDDVVLNEGLETLEEFKMLLKDIKKDD